MEKGKEKRADASRVFLLLHLLCYVALNPVLHFTPTHHISRTSLRVKLTFFCSLYLCFLYKVLSILSLVYETPEIIYHCSPVSVFFSSFLIVTHSRHPIQLLLIRVRSADVRFLQTSFVLTCLLQYFECTQPKP
jgi:hypothetical protein